MGRYFEIVVSENSGTDRDTGTTCCVFWMVSTLWPHNQSNAGVNYHPPSHHHPISSYCQCQYTHCSKKTMGFLTCREASRCSLFYSELNVKEKLSKNFLGDFLRAERSIKFPWISRLFSIKFSYQTKCWIHGKKIGFSCRSQNVTKYS